MNAAFERLELLLGADAVQKLAAARILIAGVGAVGGAAAESLARSAVGHLTLADFDIIRPGNLNRHPFAFQSTLGQLKTEAARAHLMDINPDLDVAIVNTFLDEETIAGVLSANAYDVVIDAIDGVNSKTELLFQTVENIIPLVISCMGSARKLNPTQFRVSDISKTHTCPLARILRKRLGRRGIKRGVRCVFSEEPAVVVDAPPDPEDDFYVRGRQRQPLGSLHACTAAAGQLAAAEAIHFILARPVSAEKCAPL